VPDRTAGDWHAQSSSRVCGIDFFERRFVQYRD